MFKNIVPFVLALFVSCSLWAQIPREIQILPSSGSSRSSMMCEMQNAGSIEFRGAGPDNQSNDVRTLSADEPIFLCWGDEFFVNHDQSTSVFQGDPSGPGVGYAFYTCNPTETGPTLMDILDDTCTLRSLRDMNIPLVSTSGRTTGDARFSNEAQVGGLSLQEVYNGGNPIRFWFTPITYDNIDLGSREAIYEMDGASCVNSDTAQAFSVVYLNPINVVDLSTSSCGGSLTITGGLPEFSNSSYTVDIVNANDNTVTGSIGGVARHGVATMFTVPSTGEYIISITDNKACTTSENTVNITVCDPAAVFNLELPCPGEVTSGDLFCLDFEISNFNEIVALQIPLEWDTTILDFESVSVDQAITDAISLDESFFDFTTAGKLKLAAWVSSDFVNGSSLPDGSILFTACFIPKAEGNPNFMIRDDRANNSPLEIIDVESGEISFSAELCTDPNDFSVAPRPPDGEINVRPDITAACIGDDNGKLSFSFVGGMPPYNLDLVGDNGFDESFTIFGQDTIIENLEIGSYTYLVIDEARTAQGTNVTDPITINETDLVPRVTAVDPTCFDGLGSLTASAIVLGLTVNDLSEYTFLWDDPNATTTQTLDSIGTGTLYSVTVTNPNGCTAISNGTLSSPSQIQFNIMETPAQCSGVFDGSLTVNVDPMSGTAPYTFSWDTDPEILNSTNNVLPNLTVGDYNLTVTDDNGCTVIDDSRVSGAIELSVDPTSAIARDVQCFNEANGMIQISPLINVPVNVANYAYTWSPNINQTNITSSAGAIGAVSDLSPGTYEVTITNSDIDARCFGTATFEIEEPDSLMLAIDITNTSKCFRLDRGEIPDGSAVVTASGGTEDYAYVWSDIGVDDNPSANANGITAMNLNSDTITVSVSDANGCITELDTIIGSPAPPQIISFNDDDILCADGTGTLQILPAPGDARVTDNYIWEGPSPVTSNSALVGNLEVGTYFVTVTDDNDCITVDSAEVTAPPAFDYSSFVETAPSCFGEENGAFFLELTGGTPGYTFAWFNEDQQEVAGQTTSVADVPAGFYTLSGIDGNDCEIDTTIELSSNLEIVVTFDDIMETSCALSDTPDGGATAEAIYADGTMGEFDFLWGSGETNDRVSESTAEELGSGNISVVVFESDGVCNTTAEVFVDSPAEITYDPTNEMIDNVSCFGFDDGAISTISAASGGTPGPDGFEFEWTHLPTGNNFIGEVITDLVAGDYTLVISDANDCLSSPITRTITEPELLTAVIDTDPNNTRNVSCAGDDDGQITVIATGGNDDLGPYTYEWTNNVSFESVATNLAPNITYEIVISDAIGCEATAEFLISEPADLNPYNFDFEPIQCFGEFTTIRLDPASFSGGNGGDFTYTIDGCPERDVSEPSCQVNGGMIPITVFDSGGCAYDDVIEVDEPDQIVIDFPTAEVDGNNFITEVQLGGEIALNAEIFNDISVPIAEVMWTDTTVVCPPLGDCRNGIVSPLDNTLYTIEVVDANGCEESASILVEVDKNRNVFIPNAFAPNSRGFDLNEDFKVYTGVGVRSINFAQVFNRWGTMVADLGVVNDPSPSGVSVWDGILQGELLSQGVYVYIVSVTFEDNVTLLYRGDITLLR